MAEIGQHLLRRGPDVELVPGDAERLHQPERIGLGVRAGGEARHGVGEDVGARQPEQVERLGGHDQRLGRIEPAGDADDHALDAGRAQPLRQPRDLDVVGLVAVLREPRRIGRHEREALDPPLQADIAGRRVEPERDATERATRMAPAVVVEGAHLHALLPQQVEVDIGDRDLAGRRESARSRPAVARSRRSTAWPSQARSVVDSPAPAAA